MTMPGRTYTNASLEYRYGFQNQEIDKELWDGAVPYKYRIEDPRLGRFFSVDPLAPKYPHNSTYAFSENRLIDAVELEGLEKHQVTGANGQAGYIWGPILLEEAQDYADENWTEVTYEKELNPVVISTESSSVLETVEQNFNDFWYSDFAKKIVPDYMNVGVNVSTGLFFFVQGEASITLITRGGDAGIYSSFSKSSGFRSSGGLDVGGFFGHGNYLYDSKEFKKTDLEGYSSSMGAGLGGKLGIGAVISESLELGFDPSKLKVVTSGSKTGFNIGTGFTTPVFTVSVSAGYTSVLKPIFTFK